MAEFFSSALGLKLEYELDSTRTRLREYLKCAERDKLVHLMCRVSIIYGEAPHTYWQAEQVWRDLTEWERNH